MKGASDSLGFRSVMRDASDTLSPLYETLTLEDRR